MAILTVLLLFSLLTPIAIGPTRAPGFRLGVSGGALCFAWWDSFEPLIPQLRSEPWVFRGPGKKSPSVVAWLPESHFSVGQVMVKVPLYMIILIVTAATLYDMALKGLRPGQHRAGDAQ
ncbi:MAG: hypothetical protein KF745_14710 [Phycisphaeraceae bacterium]|nr:hypothetical protein [Phycisphaeraceae bacterium]